MNSQKTKNLCKIHQRVTMDINPQIDLQNTHFCQKCLISHFSDIKRIFKQRKVAQNKKNQEILKELASNVILLKNFYIQQLEQILEQIGKFKEKIQQVDIDSFLSSTNEFAEQEVNYSQVQYIIVQQLERISDKELISKCMNILSLLDFTNINLAPEDQSQLEMTKEQRVKLQNYHIYRTPNLMLDGETHNQEIILFNLNEQKPKESRLACVTCTSDRIGPYTELKVVYRSVGKIMKLILNRSLFNAQQDSRKTKVTVIHQSLTTLSFKFQEKIANALLQLSKKWMSKKESTLYQISKMGRDWQTLSKEEIIDIAIFQANLNPKSYCNHRVSMNLKSKGYCLLQRIDGYSS